MMWFQFITRAYPKRAWRGLYGGRQLQFGNRISEQGGNKYDDAGLAGKAAWLHISLRQLQNTTDVEAQCAE